MRNVSLLFCVSVAVLFAARPRLDPKHIARQYRPKHVTADRHSTGPGPEFPDHGRRTTDDGFDDGEFMLDTSVACVPLMSGSDPVVTTDRSDYFVCWIGAFRGSSAVLAARVSSSGVPLDTLPIVVDTGVGGFCSPSACYDSTNYILIWSDSRGMCGTRVSSSGTVLDSGGVCFAPHHRGEETGIAFDGNNFLAIWSEYVGAPFNDFRICGSRIDRTCRPLDSAFTVASESIDRRAPRVAFGGNSYLVVWYNNYDQAYDDVRATRVTRSGLVLDPGGVNIAPGSFGRIDPSVLFDGANFLCVWADGRGGVYGAHMTESGEVLEPGGYNLVRIQRDVYRPSIVPGDTSFLLVWGGAQDGVPIYCTPVTRAGNAINPTGIQVLGDAPVNGSVAYGDGAYLLVTGYAIEYGLRGLRIGADGNPVDSIEFPVTLSVNSQTQPAVASGVSGYLAAWQDNRGGAAGIYGRRITISGTMPDSAALRISSGSGDNTLPAVASDGTDYFVAWNTDADTDRIRGARVSSSGCLLDTSGINVAPCWGYPRFRPAVLFDDTNYLIVSSRVSNITATRVSRQGVVIDQDPIVLSNNDDGDYYPAAARSGGNYLIVWDHQRVQMNPPAFFSTLLGRRLGHDGQILDSAPFTIAPEKPVSYYFPQVAFGGTDYSVTWAQNGISGRRIATSGQFLDSAHVGIISAGDDHTTIADETGYFVAYHHDGELYGARFSPDLDSLGAFPLATSVGSARNPAVSRNVTGGMLLVYEGQVALLRGKPCDVMRAWGKLGPFPGVEEGGPPCPGLPKPCARPTIMRGVLNLSGEPSAVSRQRPSLLDISGRKVLDLQPGENDVSRLAPGVYFISVRSAGGGRRSAVAKVVIQR